MSNETFLIPLKQNNKLSSIAIAQLRMDIEQHPLHQRRYVELADLLGNSARYSLDQLAPNPLSPLYGKKILFLGSSVTFGFGALAESFVDDLWKKDGVIATKDAENGTTLVNQNRYRPGDSYVARFREDLKREAPAAFVLQLSTNDAQTRQNLGQFNSAAQAFDLQTITGALAYIISTAKAKWHCPLLVFTNPDFGNPLYAQMVQRVEQLQKEYHFALLNLFKDLPATKKTSLYMADSIHPTRAGYLKQWTPLFEKTLGTLI